MRTLKQSKGRNLERTKEAENQVSAIIEDVRLRKDAALFDYSLKFDGSRRKIFRVSDDEISRALSALPKEELALMKNAIGNIRIFAQAQMASLSDIGAFEINPGVILGHKHIPVREVCCYIPGGRYPLFSTAMMLITPAKVAGVSRVAACSPPARGTDRVHPKTLAAAALAGVDEFYAVGGVQAIAAFSYGTEQIRPADLIAGPGNSYVAEAKRQCYGQVGIDFIAGPSEVLIIADSSAKSHLVAADLLAQCEHDPLAQGILVSTSEALAKDVMAEIEKRLKDLPTRDAASLSWEDYGEVHIAENLGEAADFANERAPEHLEIQTGENDFLIEKLYNYGSLFIGEYSAEVFGDYAAGPNHTLPTLRASRWTGGVWVGTFLKTLTFEKLSAKGAASLAGAASSLAALEGLAAHSAAAALRGERVPRP